MADALGIIGVIGVAGQILQLTVKFGLDWKDAPEDAISFLKDIQALKTVLSETHTNILVDEDFKAAFEGRRSALLSELGDLTQPRSISFLVNACKLQLEDVLFDLKNRTHGHRSSWERLKGAFTAKETRETIEDVQRRCRTLNCLISLDALSLGVQTHKEIKEARQEQKLWQDQQLSREILDWLSEYDDGAQQSDFLRRRQADTGQWLLDEPEYQNWVATPQTTLFCPGIPGAGKTLLTSVVVDDLQNRLHDDENSSMAYIYCNFRRRQEQTVENLLSTILRQLAQDQRSLPSCVKSLYQTHKKERTRPTQEQLSVTLRALIGTLPRVFIVVDALDECQLSSGNRNRFLDTIFDLQSSFKANIFATSRFIVDITDRFNGASFFHIQIRAREEDIRRYLEDNLSQLPACVTKSSELREETMTKIIHAADGMFLLAKLYLDSLKGKLSVKAIRATLQTLRSGSEAYEIYEDTMSRIDCQLEGQRELAIQALMWITCTKRPLTTAELQVALAVELGKTTLDPDNIPDIEDVVSACAGLCTVDEQGKIIRLIHYTMQEYFSTNWRRWFNDAHRRIAEICVTYLSFEMFSDFPSPGIKDNCDQWLKSNLILYYAFEYWVDHASMPGSESCNQLVSNLFLSRSSTNHPTDTNIVALQRKLGHRLFKCFNTMGLAELSVASARGRTRHVQYLLQRGACTTPNIPNRSMQMPLFCAIQGLHVDTVKILLDWNDTNVNARDQDGKTAIFVAIRAGSKPILDVLLVTNHIDLSVKTNNNETLLHAAALSGQEDMVRIFLNLGGENIKAQDNRGNTPLHLAASRGHISAVRTLLDFDGIDVNSVAAMGRTPLHLAAAAGDESTTQLLLDFNANVKATDYFGNMPIHAAASEGCEGVTRMLLNSDNTTISSRDGEGSTPLHKAATEGNEALVRMLLSINDLDINARGFDGSTPFSKAAEHGRRGVLKLLLATGTVDINDTDEFGRSPLWKAVDSGHKDVVQFLLGVEGLNFGQRYNQGRTLLHCAAENGHTAVAKVLVGTGRFRTNPRSRTGKTPLWFAASNGNLETAKFLLGIAEVRKGLKFKDTQGNTALAAAEKAGYEDVVELLAETSLKCRSDRTRP